MHARSVRLALATFFLTALAGCGTRETPYDRFTDPPLVDAVLHAVTLVADSEAAAAEVLAAGYAAVDLPANYSRADEVQASIWGVPEPVAKAVRTFKAPGAPDLRLLVMPLAARERAADARERESFFRNVLGTAVPEWPLRTPPTDALRLHALTYRIADVVAGNRRLRENGIPVIYDPVGLTTSYLGDHRTLAIRAPDGVVVQLVQTATE